MSEDHADETRESPRTPGLPRPAGETLPERVGRYVVEGEIGRGGMGIVYRARDTRLDRIVALKALPHDISTGVLPRERFEREARLLAALEDPHVAAIHGIEDAGGRSFLVLQHVEGETLAARLRRGRLAVREACDVARQIAAGLAAAHRRGIVHCDLKPGNVMVTPDGTVKLLDFGIATRWRRDPDARREAAIDAAESIGTPAYMSPEQIRGDALDPRTDVWSFGCVLLECLTGAKAFDAANTEAELDAVLLREPDLSELGDGVPPPVRELLGRCLVKDRDGRLDDVAEAGRVLEAIATAAEPPARAPALPRSPTRFVGREREVEEVSELLGRSRLVTLTGTAGCGKTRLALECARRATASQPATAWLAPLAPIGDPAHVVAAIASAVGVAREQGRSVEDATIGALRDRQGLLILDNCEHLLEECARVATLVLDSCPGITILATSREALGLPGEVARRVRSLSHPTARTLPAPDELIRFDGVRLFVERARDVQPSFALDAANAPAVAAIVERLDGIPLALELAAARLRVLSPQQVLDRLADRFRLLTGGSRTAIERHQTLLAALEWSHDLLDGDEQRCLRELSVFAGGFRLEEATRICSGDEFEVLDRITHLVDKSLVQVEVEARKAPRYRLLESVRQLAADKLRAAGETDDVRARHHDCYLALATELSADPRRKDSGRVAVLVDEQENLRVALDWCTTRCPPDEVLHFVRELHRFWEQRGLSAESRAWLERAIARPGAPSTGRDFAVILHALSIACWWMGDIEDALAHARRSLPAAVAAGDQATAANAEMACAISLHVRGRLAEARDAYDLALRRSREAQLWPQASTALNNLGIVSRDLGDLEGARRWSEESLALAEERGWTTKIGRALRELAISARDRGDNEEARRLAERAIAIHETNHEAREVANARIEVAKALAATGDAAEACRVYQRCVRDFREVADQRGLSGALGGLGGCLRESGALDEAWTAFREALAILLPARMTAYIASTCEQVAWLRFAQGRPVEAARIVGAVNAARESIGRKPAGPDEVDRLRRTSEIRAVLGEGAFATEVAAGEAMGLMAMAEGLVDA